MKAKTDSISKALDLAPIEYKRIDDNSDPEPLVISADDQVADDAEFARKNMLKLIDTGMFTVERLAELADCSENTEAYKSVAPVIKAMIDANRELLKLHEDKRKLLGENVANTTVINNNLVLTTNDVLKLIKGHNSNTTVMIGVEDKKED